MWIGVHIMMLFGFGNLMTFLHRSVRVELGRQSRCMNRSMPNGAAGLTRDPNRTPHPTSIKQLWILRLRLHLRHDLLRYAARTPQQSNSTLDSNPTTNPTLHHHPPNTGLQWCIINYDFWHGLLQGQLTRPTIDLAALFQGDFGVAAVLISFGGLLGKVSPTQLLWLCMLEIVFYAINEALVSDVRATHQRGRAVHPSDALNTCASGLIKHPNPQVLMAADAGGSIVIHTFGTH